MEYRVVISQLVRKKVMGKPHQLKKVFVESDTGTLIALMHQL